MQHFLENHFKSGSD